MGAIPDNMVSVRTVPWHKNATIVQDQLTARDALILAGLDWPVTKVPVYVRNDATDLDTLYQEVEGHEAVVRDDTGEVMQIATPSYTVVQNHEAFAFFDKVVESDAAKYETAGSLKGGRVIFITAISDRDPLMIGGVDQVTPYLFLANSHDSSMAFSLNLTPVRVVCENTMNLGLQTANASWKMRHTAAIEDQVKEAQSVLGIVSKYYDAFQAEADAMINTELTKVQFEQLVKDVFPSKARANGAFSAEQYAIIGCLDASPTIDDAFRRTQWGAINAVGEYLDWSKTGRSKDEDAEDERRTMNTVFGSSRKKRDQFYAAMVAA